MPAATHVALASLSQTTERPQWKGRLPHSFRAELEAQPVIGYAVCELGDALLRGLADRTRELVALRVNAVLEDLGSYAWAGHCFISVGGVLRESDIARIAAAPHTFDGHDMAVLRAVDALLLGGRLDAALRAELGADRLGVIVATGMYRMVASIMQDVPPEPGTTIHAGIETPARARQTYAAGS